MTITTRQSKGQSLTNAEMDENITDLRDKPEGQVYPKTSGIGLKLDNASPDWGWHDLLGVVRLGGTANDPVYAAYQGNILQPQFDVGDEVYIEFHMPHDYAPGTDVFIHAHWSHNSALVTTGGVQANFEVSYAKGHNQAAFATPVIVSVSENASPIRYQHMVTEGQLSAALGAGGVIPTENLEVDGLFLCRVELTGNTMDGGAKPFMHAVDIHYQSTGLPTKQKSPDFWT